MMSFHRRTEVQNMFNDLASTGTVARGPRLGHHVDGVGDTLAADATLLDVVAQVEIESKTWKRFIMC